MKKKTWMVILTFVLAIGMTAPQSMVFASSKTGASKEEVRAEYAKDQVLVVYNSKKISKGKIAGIMSKDNGEVEDTIKISSDKKAALVDIDKNDTVESAIEKYEKNPEVAYAQPNYKYKALEGSKTSVTKSIQTSLNDIDAGKLWHFNNINLEVAWNYLKANSHSKVRVAVLDTGADINHEDLQANLNKDLSVDVVDGTPGSFPKLTGDGSSHGTHVAGIIGATANNGKGVAGVASGYNNDIIEMIAVDVFDGSDAFTDDMVRGVNYAASQGARVINMSLGYSTTTPKDQWDQMLEDSIDDAVDGGASVVCASGNDNNNVTNYPSDFDSVISVISTGLSDVKDPTSNFGAEKDISAPGVQIYSTIPSNGYGEKTGTSMATPVVSGVIALMLADDPSKTPAQIKSILYGTAKDLGAVGKDDTYGNGLIDAGRALTETKVSYNAGGGKVSQTMKTVRWDNPYGDLPVPSRTGYTFDDWYTAASGGTVIRAASKVYTNKPHILYAHWRANTYVASYNANGGTVGASSKVVTYDGQYGLLPSPSKTGYIFQGWFTEKTGGTKITSSSVVKKTANHTLYAHWKSKKAITVTKKPIYKVTSGRTVKVSWKKKSGVHGYLLYQKRNKGAYKKLRLVEGNKSSVKFVVKTGYSYRFKVKPYKVKSGKVVTGTFRKAKKRELNKAVEAYFNNITGYDGYEIQMKWGKKAKASTWTSWKTVKKAKVLNTGQMSYVKNKAIVGYSYKARIKGYKIVNGKKKYTVIKCTKLN